MPQKAVIEVLEGDPAEKEIEVIFNPESYQLSYGAAYGEKKIAGLNGPISQFISGERMTLDMTLYFDTYVPATPAEAEGGTSVAEKTKLLSGLLLIDGTLHRPPIVKFKWGTLQFKGVVTSVKESYTMFLSDGTPVRAKADISFQSVPDMDTAKRQAPFESPDRTKIRVVHEREQLWNYAWQEYKDVSKWREIADANQIRNPLELEPGTEIRLPALPAED